MGIEDAATSIFNDLLPPSGEEALFYPQSSIRWSNKQAGGQWIKGPVTDDQRGLYRIWSVADLGAYIRAAQGIAIRLTAAAQAKMTATPRLDPCQPQGMPGIMLNPLPMQFIDRGDHIDLQLTTFGVSRRIDMTVRASTEAVPLSDLGYSAGRWVADTLEVRTTRVGWPYVDDDGRPLHPSAWKYSSGFRSRIATAVWGIPRPSPIRNLSWGPMTVSWDLIDAGETSIEPLRCE